MQHATFFLFIAFPFIFIKNIHVTITFHLQYKDAFLTANPNFRWYKLPAPPLRTLSTRPLTITKNPTPLSSPTSPLTSEFNLGKLADESQLGGLTSLMNNNYSGLPKKEDEDILEDTKFMEKISMLRSETDNVILPPKPIKKRFLKVFADDLKYSSSMFPETETKDIEEEQLDETGSLTKQDLMNKVRIFLKKMKMNFS